jgi:ribosomal protein S18 acetylase RimI-like enzyme
MTVIHVAASEDAERVRELLRAYAAELDVDLAFQDFETELADPLGFYELVLLAADGCIALRRLDEKTCEMKRLYVAPAARGTGLGHALAETLIAHARARGYDRMRLDTLPTMSAARKLYAALGFEEIEAYRYNPVPGTTYFELDLAG